ncbi:MAG: DNA topology modulation protein FlaR [Vagococcus sp.]
MKWSILGYSGSGKSTLARFISETQHIPCLHLDQVKFTENWQEREHDRSIEQVEEFLQNDNWVIDGNYQSFLYQDRLERSDVIVLMLFSRWASLFRVFKRYHKYKGNVRPDMSDGCKESLNGEFLWWVLYRGRTKSSQVHYKQIMNRYPDKVIVIRTQSDLSECYKRIERVNVARV